ncbi:MAG: hypothetical protein ACOC9Q_01060 [bacterium]
MLLWLKKMEGKMEGLLALISFALALAGGLLLLVIEWIVVLAAAGLIAAVLICVYALIRSLVHLFKLAGERLRHRAAGKQVRQ